MVKDIQLVHTLTLNSFRSGLSSLDVPSSFLSQVTQRSPDQLLAVASAAPKHFQICRIFMETSSVTLTNPEIKKKFRTEFNLLNHQDVFFLFSNKKKCCPFFLNLTARTKEHFKELTLL